MRGETEWSCASRDRSDEALLLHKRQCGSARLLLSGVCVALQLLQPLKLQFGEVQKGLSRSETREVSPRRVIGHGKEGSAW